MTLTHVIIIKQEKMDLANAKHKYNLAKIDYRLFTNPVMTPGVNAPEKWEVSKQFREIKDNFPQTPYADSAKMYMDSLDNRFDSGELRP